MKSLPQRIVSALVALIVMFVVNYFFHTSGVIALGFLLCLGGAFEFQKIAFAPLQLPVSIRVWFLFVCLLLLFVTLFSTWLLISTWGILITTYFAGALWLLRDKIENEKILTTLSISALGFIYCALLPTFALSILQLPNGILWFMLLVSVVFGGDIFAYFGGIWFGEKKLMPNISPNKTNAGSIAGVLGSVIASLLIGHFGLKTVPLFYLVGLSAFASVLAQNGDLFESLLKRVASLKDSGRFMPGHGGILDRLDGIYFAAPLVYAFAVALSS